ncbi:hypothetical protein Taro_016260 [Colocasia esculenta]|uniref:protein-serine/threonine phosphatase n=1 Tax=Colocasia esculenta TaxID=4460 RepID=A0A843UPP8_COLES|nr:hypothetical protein [Colocasia esculenta]
MEGCCGRKAKSARRRRLEILRLRGVELENGFGRGKRAKDGGGSGGDSSESTVESNSSVSSTAVATSSTSCSSSPSSSSSLSPQSEPEVAPDVGGGGEPRGSSPPCVSHGSVSVIGRRREMEDAVAVAPGFAAPAGGRPYDFFGVYDGHGGARVAEACRERLHVVLAAEAEVRVGAAGEGWREAMAACFHRVDGEVVRRAETGPASERMVGSTAVVAVVGAGRIVVANCGDSRAVLSRSGVAVPLSSDHKPDRPDELERVEAAGGRVINWDGYRVLGVLATSRSIGDLYLKPYVTSEPEVTVTERTGRDEFLILASDGLWDVVSNEVACSVTRRCLAGRLPLAVAAARPPHGRGAEEAAAVLAELAMSRGSRDNISVVVVELRRSTRA